MDEQQNTQPIAQNPVDPIFAAGQPQVAPVTPEAPEEPVITAPTVTTTPDYVPTTPVVAEPVVTEPTAPDPAFAAVTDITPAPDTSSTNQVDVAAPVSPEKLKKILLVEDDEALAAVYKTRLLAEGFDVKHVPNGEDALAAAVNFHPDLILLDVMMPKVSGFDVLDILRNTPETLNIKVIMLTALSQDADKERAMSLGVDDYIVKSQVVIADVVDRIKKHLN